MSSLELLRQLYDRALRRRRGDADRAVIDVRGCRRAGDRRGVRVDDDRRRRAPWRGEPVRHADRRTVSSEETSVDAGDIQGYAAADADGALLHRGTAARRGG